jgi:signal transduction histidine kinase
VRAVREAHEEAGRLARLVTDLLALARADAGVPIRRGPVELDRVLLDVVGEARHLTTGQSLEIGHIDPILIDGDADRLRQLLLILLDNAIRYTPSPGRIIVGLRVTAGAVEVEVLDEGVGIAAGDLPHVFERFYRADPARSRAPGGSGLGLSIASWIAERHGGRVTLSSVAAGGAPAVLRLPASLPVATA